MRPVSDSTEHLGLSLQYYAMCWQVIVHTVNASWLLWFSKPYIVTFTTQCIQREIHWLFLQASTFDLVSPFHFQSSPPPSPQPSSGNETIHPDFNPILLTSAQHSRRHWWDQLALLLASAPDQAHPFLFPSQTPTHPPSLLLQIKVTKNELKGQHSKLFQLSSDLWPAVWPHLSLPQQNPEWKEGKGLVQWVIKLGKLHYTSVVINCFFMLKIRPGY